MQPLDNIKISSSGYALLFMGGPLPGNFKKGFADNIVGMAHPQKIEKLGIGQRVPELPFPNLVGMVGPQNKGVFWEVRQQWHALLDNFDRWKDYQLKKSVDSLLRGGLFRAWNRFLAAIFERHIPWWVGTITFPYEIGAVYALAPDDAGQIATQFEPVPHNFYGAMLALIPPIQTPSDQSPGA